jgi:hypothetical protein
LVFHVISGPVHFSVGLYHGFILLFNQTKLWPGWLGQNLLSMLAWIGRVISKILDVVLLGELIDLVFQIVKPNSRALTLMEIAEAQKVFGKGIPYWQVRVDELSLIAWIGAWLVKGKSMGVTTFHTVNFTRKLTPEPGNHDMEWLIHELAHVSQMEHAGIQYIVEALVAQYTGGYSYGGKEALAGKRLRDFNREQQSEIAADYYKYVLYGRYDPKYYEHLIDEFRTPRKLFYQNLFNDPLMYS